MVYDALLLVPLILLHCTTTQAKTVKMKQATPASANMLYGDMLISPVLLSAKKARKAMDDELYYWSEGDDGYPLVPYIFKESVSQEIQGDIRAGMDHWMEHTCIKFENTRNTEQHHLQFNRGEGCYATVGMQWWSNGQEYPYGQEINIGPGCESLGVVVHEIGHAIGLWHEHSRTDRDRYVTIVYKNVVDGQNYNFDKELSDNNYSVPYDYASIMHYGLDHISKNRKPTIVSKNPLALGLMGIQTELSHRDKLLVNRMYKFTDKWIKKCNLPKETCLNDGYTGKDCTCICPPGTTGSKCKTIVGDYYTPLLNPLTETITTATRINIETPLAAATRFVKWIVPGTCQKAKVTFTSSDMYPDCNYQYLNVRTNSKDLSGEIMCATDVTAGVSLESQSGIIITMVNNVNYAFQSTLWVADVTFINIQRCSPPAPETSEIPILPCIKKAKVKTLLPGTAVIISSPNLSSPSSKQTIIITSPNLPSTSSKTTCKWKLKAKKKSLLTITCEHFALHKKNKFKINNKIFKGENSPSLTAKKMNILFKAKSSGSGFKCTVVSE